MSTLKGITRLPPGKTIKIGADGKTYLVSKGRRKYKTPARVRRSIAAGLRRFKAPLLSATVIGVPLFLAWKQAVGAGATFQTRSFVFGRELLSYYTGIQIASNSTVKWIPSKMMVGLLPLIGLGLIKRFGLFKGVNTTLGRLRMPFRLS